MLRPQRRSKRAGKSRGVPRVEALHWANFNLIGLPHIKHTWIHISSSIEKSHLFIKTVKAKESIEKGRYSGRVTRRFGRNSSLGQLQGDAGSHCVSGGQSVGNGGSPGLARASVWENFQFDTPKPLTRIGRFYTVIIYCCTFRTVKRGIGRLLAIGKKLN